MTGLLSNFIQFIEHFDTWLGAHVKNWGKSVLLDLFIKPGEEISLQEVKPGEEISLQEIKPGEEISLQEIKPGEEISLQEVKTGLQVNLKSFCYYYWINQIVFDDQC